MHEFHRYIFEKLGQVAQLRVRPSRVEMLGQGAASGVDERLIHHLSGSARAAPARLLMMFHPEDTFLL
jgi:hypothetical protein